jgi:HPt (histidine-containing phosphotransfer) domain-containing protein
MDSYLSKPIQAQALFDTIATLLADRTASAATPAPAPPTPAPFDRAALLARFDDDEELFHEVVATFLETAPVLLRELRNALGARDAVALARVTHTLNGSVSVFGETTVLSSLQRLHALSQAQTLADADETYEVLEMELRQFTLLLATLAMPVAA